MVLARMSFLGMLREMWGALELRGQTMVMASGGRRYAYVG